MQPVSQLAVLFMQTLAAFLPRVLPKAPGCSTPLAEQSLVDAAIAFCEESLAIREWRATFPTVAATAAYTQANGTYETVSKVLAVRIDGMPIEPMQTRFEGQLITSSGRPTRFFTQRTGDVTSLVLYPTPDRVYTVEVQVANRPIRGTTQLADDLFHLWVEPVTAGALARIQSVAGQPFYDPASAVANNAMAISGARRALQVTDTGGVQAVSGVAMSPWGTR